VSSVAVEEPGVRRVEQIMGMPILVDVRDDVGEGVLDEVFDCFRLVDETFSTYKRDSEIRRIARCELPVAEASADVQWVLERCEELRRETDRYFDAYASGSLDPSGLVKGWSVDRAAALLARAGAENYAVNAGGDIRLHGGALPGSAWRVGIQHPRLRDQVAAVVQGSDLAVATSGTYARGEHVLDPHTRLAPTGVLSVTITGPDLATADAYATAAFAMGERAAEWTAGLPDSYEAMTILADDRVLLTRGFPRAEI
jgi:thiamine biosynthesis lipoprotein